jgi:hypothetical protein
MLRGAASTVSTRKGLAMNGLKRFGGLVVDPKQVFAISTDSGGDVRVFVTDGTGGIQRLDSRRDDVWLLAEFLGVADAKALAAQGSASS